MKRVGVIGSGIGGLALAIRLQAAGIATVLIEKRDVPGGWAQAWHHEGFTFETGPTLLTNPAAFSELWALCGRDLAHEVALQPVDPFCRFHWPDGTTFDYQADEARMYAEVARIAPGDMAGYKNFMAYATQAYDEIYTRLASRPFPDFSSRVRTVPALIRLQAWRSVYTRVAGFVRSERLRQALTCPILFAGGNPMNASAVYVLAHTLARKGGIWWVPGGTSRLVAGMAALYQQMGGELRLADPAVRVHALGDHAHEIETASGWRERFDAIASNADLMQTYRDLLGHYPRARAVAHRLARKRWSPGVFVMHFGVDGVWPDIAQHTILFGPRYRGLLNDIFEHGVLSRDLLIYLHHPSSVDPAMAPAGQSAFTAVVPVAHQGKLSIDWNEVAPMLVRRVLDEMARRYIPDIDQRLITQRWTTPTDFAGDLNTYMGSACSLEPTLTQSGFFRARHRDTVIKNFYLVGAGTHPGAGIAGVMASARTVASLILEDLHT